MFVSYDICRNRTGSSLHTETSCVLGGNFIITWVFLITRYLLPIRISQSIVNLDRRLQTVIVTREQSPFRPSQPPLSPSHCSSRNHRDLSLLVSREVSRVTVVTVWPLTCPGPLLRPEPVPAVVLLLRLLLLSRACPLWPVERVTCYATADHRTPQHRILFCNS